MTHLNISTLILKELHLRMDSILKDIKMKIKQLNKLDLILFFIIQLKDKDNSERSDLILKMNS